MKKVWLKIKNWFIKIKPSKRKIVQLYVALLYNANLKGFIKGDIFKGKSKLTCVPGLNCYSCPGAVSSCPLGSLQNAIGGANKGTIFYVLGIIMLYGLILGRTICGWLCPVGLVQELLYKIKTPKLRKSKFTKLLSYFKYVLLVVFVIVLPFAISSPTFCKFICPAGVFEGAFFLLGHDKNEILFKSLGPIFTWKFVVLVIFAVAAVFIFRFFCRFFCPLGAIYGFFNKFSFLGVKVDQDKCTECGRCVSHCKMDITKVGDHECINCGDCIKQCPTKAIDWKLIKNKIHEEENNNLVENNEENKKVIENNSEKKNKTRLILQIGAVVVLVVSLIYFNFIHKQDGVQQFSGNTIENFEINMYENEETYNINNSKVKIIYFYNNYADLDWNYINNLANNNLNVLDVITIHNYDNYTEISRDYYSDSNIIFGYDNENQTALKVLNDKLTYPSLVILDSNNYFVYQDVIIEKENLKYYLNPLLEGKKIGNQIGDICLDYELPIFYKEDYPMFSVNDSRGKVTIINFWSITCSGCIAEMPYFEKFYKQYSDKVNLVAFHTIDYSEDKMFETMEDQGWDLFNMPFGRDQKDNPFKDYFTDSTALPLTIVLNNYGVICQMTNESMSVEKLIGYYNAYNVE